MPTLHRSIYLQDQSLLASFVGSIIDTSLLKGLSFTAVWTAVAATDGDFYVETTDDPRAEMDKQRGTSTAVWNKVPLALDVGFYGTSVVAAGDGKGVDIDANAGQCTINLVDLQSFARLGYTRRGGGAAGQLQVFCSGD